MVEPLLNFVKQAFRSVEPVTETFLREERLNLLYGLKLLHPYAPSSQHTI